MKTILCILAISAGTLSPVPAQTNDTTTQYPKVRFGSVVPLSRYVRLVAGQRQIDPDTPVALNPEEILLLRLIFVRDSLSAEDGPQFLKVTTTSTNRNEHILDDNVQFAITFRRLADASADLRELERFGSQVAPLGYMNAEMVQAVSIQVDSLGEWGHLFIRIEPEQEIVKYFGRIKNRLEYHILVKGRTLETGFTLSVPKVLYDTRRPDSVVYGKSSAMLRLYFLNGETGIRYPISFGVGTFGVDSPIDVSRSGGGFAMSLYFDVVQMLRSFDIKLSYGVNAGFDISPFFSIGHKPRLLFNARLGISP